MTATFDLSGQVVLVTGASSGIGKSICLLLDRCGARVILAGRRADALAETQAAMTATAGHLLSTYELSEVDGIPGWIKTLREQVGAPFSGAVHCAGVGGPTPLRTLSRKQLDAIVVPNLYSGLLLIRGMAARGIAADGTSIVLMSSVAGLAGAKGMIAYAASKGAMSAAVRTAAMELADRRFRINGIAPAYVATPMLAHAQANLPGQASEAARQFLGLIRPEHVATAAAYLLSESGRSITGTILPMDAGFML